MCRFICGLFGHVQICRNYYFLPNSFSTKEDVFPCALARVTDEIENHWCLSSHGEFLGF